MGAPITVVVRTETESLSPTRLAQVAHTVGAILGEVEALGVKVFPARLELELNHIELIARKKLFREVTSFLEPASIEPDQRTT